LGTSKGLGRYSKGQPRQPRLDLAQQVDARAAGHADVADHDLRFVAVQRGQHLACAGEAAHRELLARQRLLEHEADRVVVVDDPDGFHAFRACAGIKAMESGS
jgi:predicted protein tyrosine phosphatase